MLFVLLLAAFGGFTGLVFGEVTGMVIGALAGYGIGFWFRQAVVRRGQQIIQQQYFESVFSVMGHVCREDSAITGDEIWAADRVFDRLELTGDVRKTARAEFDRGRAEDFDLPMQLSALRRVAGGHRTLLPAFLQVQHWALAADGELHEEGRALIERLADSLIVPEHEIRRLEAMLRGGATPKAPPGLALEDAYAVLGTDHEASDNDVRRAARTLRNQNDIDALLGQGMPACLRPVIAARARAIDAAERTVAAARREAA